MIFRISDNLHVGIIDGREFEDYELDALSIGMKIITIFTKTHSIL
jgi:hypothetical protein